jgi:phosphohistidine phosphatase
VGIALAREKVRFESVLYSPKERAHRTAALAAEDWSARQSAVMREHPALAGGFDARQALHELDGLAADGRLLLVGHEPDFSCIVGELTGASVDLKKGGVAVVRLDGAAGELIVVMRPRELALIAGLPLERD